MVRRLVEQAKVHTVEGLIFILGEGFRVCYPRRLCRGYTAAEMASAQSTLPADDGSQHD
jgi:hypothetical protein